VVKPGYAAQKSSEWQSRLLRSVSGLMVFETLTGLSIFLLPFSVSNQVMVILHTGIGLVCILPFVWYLVRHWRTYRSLRLSHETLTGYFALGATLVLVISGLVLTWQSVVGTRIGRVWDLSHIVATFALVASVVPHLATVIVRALAPATREPALARAVKGFGLSTMLWTGGLIAVAVVGALWVAPAPFVNELPEDYSYLYGPERPFAPSLARTSTGGAFDARSLSGSASCGTAGCHKAIYDEWAVSAHRYSAMDAAFLAVQSVMGKQNGAESTRYCGGCHDPISLFSGTKNIFVEDLTSLSGYQEGISCVSCHSISETDVQGNANYVISQPGRYLFEGADGGPRQLIGEFLIKAYPRYHVKSLQHKLFKSPEFCAACHKQFIDEEINQVGWVQLQNQFDNWRKSRWNTPGDPTKTVECRECHMPLVASEDPGRGDDLDYNRSPTDGKHRSHRFLAANQFMPLALELPGAAEHVALTEKWLRGEIDVPEIADKWREGPAVPIRIVAPPQVSPGEPVTIQTVLTNNKVGHDFPTGPLDIIQAWVEVEVTDQNGNVVYRTGQRDSSHFIAPGSFILKAEPVDQYGNLIDRHNLWEMVGVRYRRSLFPGLSDQAEFTFLYPGAIVTAGTETALAALDRVVAVPPPTDAVTELRVTARLLYRKTDQFLLNFLFTEEAGITAPVTVMSEDHATIPVTTGMR